MSAGMMLFSNFVTSLLILLMCNLALNDDVAFHLFMILLQRGTKRYVNLAKQDTGKARQSS